MFSGTFGVGFAHRLPDFFEQMMCRIILGLVVQFVRRTSHAIAAQSFFSLGQYLCNCSTIIRRNNQNITNLNLTLNHFIGLKYKIGLTFIK